MPAGVGGERGIWRYLWALPQAVAWEELDLVRTVARYAVLLPAAERVGCPVPVLAEVRQFEDRLGLNPLAMRRLFWEVKASAEVAVEDEAGQPVATLAAYRARAAG